MLSVTSSKKQRPHSKCNHQISRLKQAFLNGGTSQNQRDEASMERKCPWWLHRMQQMVSRPTPKSFKRLGRNMWNRASCNEHIMLKTLLSCAAIHFSIAWARLHPTFSQLLLHTLQISNVKEGCMLNPVGGFLVNSKKKIWISNVTFLLKQVANYFSFPSLPHTHSTNAVELQR